MEKPSRSVHIESPTGVIERKELQPQPACVSLHVTAIQVDISSRLPLSVAQLYCVAFDGTTGISKYIISLPEPSRMPVR
jgi:hypothetical protein